MAGDIIHIRTEDEITQLHKLTDRCFFRPEGGMALEWAHCYDLNTCMCFGIQDNGNIVSHVGIVPQTLLCGKDRISCWGITAVCTYKHYRGRGYMTQLLEHCCGVMRENGAALSDLGGDRQRYNHFGYERAGFHYSFVINGRSAANSDMTERDYSKVEEYKRQKHEEIVMKLHAADKTGLERKAEDYDYFLKRPKYKTLVYTEKGQESYIVFTLTERSRRVAEFSGTSKGLGVLIRTVFNEWDTGSLEFVVPLNSTLISFFQTNSCRWKLENHRMITIIDLEKTLSGFNNQLQENIEAAGSEQLTGESVTLKLDSETETVQVNCSGTDVTITKTDAEPDLELDSIAMVNLLFNPPEFSGDIYKKIPVLTRLFPLDFFIWPLESV